jgi:hypothetical protein
MRFEAPVDSLLEFTGRLIEENDGVVEWDHSRNSFHTLLPRGVQDLLGLQESLVTISGSTDTASDPSTIPIGFGTELLDRAIPMALETGRTAAVRMPAPSSRKKAGLDPGSHFTFPNAAFKETEDHESWLDYWLWSFEVAAEADERRETVHHVCVSSSGAGCPELADLILGQALDWEPLRVEASDVTAKKLESLFLIACSRAFRLVDQRLNDFKETVTRHHLRDIHRIETYFEDLCCEMEEEIRKRQLKGADLEIRKEKIGQLAGEKSRKLAALKEKYRVRLTFRPLTLLLARLPVRRSELLVKRRKEQRRLGLTYNLLSRRFDPMACEACGADTYTLGFCDESLHMLCAVCLSAYAAQKSCPRCRGKRPPSTFDEVFQSSGMPDGGPGLSFQDTKSQNL